MIRKSFWVVGYDGLVNSMMNGAGWAKANQMEDAEIVIFTGGADVNPAFYGHEKHPTTGCNTARDVDETRTYGKTRLDQLKVGICRGSQLLCVLNGGTLYQDVDCHAMRGTHECTYIDENNSLSKFQVTSTHHQMQNPFVPQIGVEDLNYELWGYTERCSYRDQDELEQVPLNSQAHPDVEILYWPDSHSLGFQGHPEYDSEECRKLFFICLNRALAMKE